MASSKYLKPFEVDQNELEEFVIDKFTPKEFKNVFGFVKQTFNNFDELKCSTTRMIWLIVIGFKTSDFHLLCEKTPTSLGSRPKAVVLSFII